MIPIQNIYYMLSYAFQILNEQGYKNIATEQFNNTAELMAAILEKGIAIQLKRGLGKEYISQTEALSSLRGKIDIAESIKTQSMLRKQLICTYDEFSVNSIMNRIIKSTVELLLRSNISKQRKKNLGKLMVYFSEVDLIDLHTINWNVQYNRNNQTYRMLISICYLVVKGLLQTQTDGITKLMDFLDEQRMCRLYEKFILEYYRREFRNQITANASQIPWQLDNDENSMLPVMQSDIMLQRDDKVLIIDAKYYEHSTQVQFDKHTLHSVNLYQIFTYVKNKEYELREKKHMVSGMLLYANLWTNDSFVKSIKRTKVEERKNVQEELSVTQNKSRLEKKSVEKETVTAHERSGMLEFLDEEERRKVLSVACSLEISENTRLHRALVQYKKQISEYNAELKNVQNQRYYNKSKNEPEFFKEVSKEGTKRLMAILDALFKAVEKLGGYYDKVRQEEDNK